MVQVESIQNMKWWFYTAGIWKGIYKRVFDAMWVEFCAASLSSALKLRENYDWHNQSYGHQVLEQPFLQMNTPAAIIHARESHSRLWIVFLRLRDWARENLSQERATRYLVPHLESWTEYASSWHQPIPSECKHFLSSSSLAPSSSWAFLHFSLTAAAVKILIVVPPT